MVTGCCCRLKLPNIPMVFKLAVQPLTKRDLTISVAVMVPRCTLFCFYFFKNFTSMECVSVVWGTKLRTTSSYCYNIMSIYLLSSYVFSCCFYVSCLIYESLLHIIAVFHHVSSESDPPAIVPKVGRGIELWNRDTMVAYREDPFLDSSGRMNIGEKKRWLYA